MLLAKDEELALDLNRIFHFEDVTERRFLAWTARRHNPGSFFINGMPCFAAPGEKMIDFIYLIFQASDPCFFKFISSAD